MDEFPPDFCSRNLNAQAYKKDAKQVEMGRRLRVQFHEKLTKAHAAGKSYEVITFPDAASVPLRKEILDDLHYRFSRVESWVVVIYADYEEFEPYDPSKPAKWWRYRVWF